MKIGKVIRSRRKSAGLSQGDLAEACELSQAYLSQVERGLREPHMNSLKRICAYLDIPMPLLFFLAVDEEDIAEEKRGAFNLLFPSMKALMLQLFPEQKKMMKEV